MFITTHSLSTNTIRCLFSIHQIPNNFLYPMEMGNNSTKQTHSHSHFHKLSLHRPNHNHDSAPIVTVSNNNYAATEADPEAEEPTWPELLGSNNWEGLLDPLNLSLRKLVLRCGDLIQCTYDAFNNDENSKYCGSSRYGKASFFNKVMFEAASDYQVVSFLYATARVGHREAFFFHSQSRESWDRESNWIGFIAVTTDEASSALGRREIYVVWRGTTRNYEWIDVLGAELESAQSLMHPQHVPAAKHGNDGDASSSDSDDDNEKVPKVMRGWLTIYTSDDPKSPFTKTSVRVQLLTKIKGLIKQYQDEKVSVTLAGHSLGASLSVLSAFDLVENGVSDIPVSAIVFGCPQVGNKAFNQRFKSYPNLNVLHVRNTIDLIPHYPGHLLGFVDTGIELVIDTRKSPSLKDSKNPSDWHNLQAMLHVVAGWNGKEKEFELKVKRSLALVNKSCEFLKDECLVPGSWWIEKNKGMVRDEKGDWVLAPPGDEDLPVPELKHIRGAEVDNSIKEIFELLGKKNKVFVEMERWFGYTTLNMVSRMVVGKQFGGTTTKENEANDEYRKAMREFFDLTGTFVVSDALPYLRWLDVGGYEKAMKKTAKKLDHMVGEWLEEHKQRKLCGGMKEPQDFMDVLLSVVTDEDEISSYDADTIIKATCLGLILAATDTTTVTLTWALSLLLNNREALKKAKQELDIQVGRERQVKESDVKNLVYLQAILKETMRLYPAGPLLLPHESLEDCTLAGYNIPIGTRLLVNVSKLHRDPSVWVNPTEFRPERFLTTHKDVDVKGQHFELIPFGSGRRMCPGISFALQVTQLTLATLLHTFEIATPSNEPVDMTEKVGLTNLKATPLEVSLTPCLAAQAYA